MSIENLDYRAGEEEEEQFLFKRQLCEISNKFIELGKKG